MQYRAPNATLNKELAKIGDLMSVDWAKAMGPNAEKILAPLR
jgi:hypothetical protein